jgi:hypothetical protein
MAKTLNNKSSVFRLCAVLVVLAAVSGACVSTVRAQVWTEPTSTPPNNNANPPIWNQSAVVQPSSNFNISGNGTMGALVLPGSSSGTVTVDSPATVTTSYTLILPATPGTNGQVLSTNGSGTTSWTTIAAGGNQTPWTSNINGAGYSLTGVSTLNTTGAITQNGVAVCLSNGTNCLASGGYWSVNGSYIYNNTGTNVGVGTSAPTEKLFAAGAIGVSGPVTSNDASSTKLAYQATAPTGGVVGSLLGSWGTNTSTRGAINFYIATSSGASGMTPMVISNTGYVGIYNT